MKVLTAVLAIITAYLVFDSYKDRQEAELKIAIWENELKQLDDLIYAAPSMELFAMKLHILDHLCILDATQYCEHNVK